MGAVDRRGYGGLRVSKKLKLATHVALELAGRPLPSGMWALHSCDNPCCVNADHLFAGTHKDNVSDMMKKDRHDHSGLDVGRKIKHPEKKEIARTLYREGKTITEMATQLGVSLTAVFSWMKEWGHKPLHSSLRTHCPSGHPYSEENTYIGPTQGDRQCRECKRIWGRQYKMRKRGVS